MVAEFLSRFPPCDFAFKVISQDSEASSYRSDFQAPLTKAGWTLTTIDYSDDIQDGVRTNFVQTTEHQKQPNDTKNPKPDLLLQMALGLAGVRFDGSGGGGAATVTKDLVTIEIGHRRKDSYTFDPPNWY